MSIAVETPTDKTLVMSRSFAAPLELVFACHTQPEHIRHWWGRGNPLDCEMDFRVGGRYRFVEHAPDGDWAFRGEYRDIQAPHRIVQTFEFEGMPGHICEETLDLTEEDGRTTVTSVTRFDTKEQRDGMVQSGMSEGAGQSYDALAAYLAKLS